MLCHHQPGWPILGRPRAGRLPVLGLLDLAAPGRGTLWGPAGDVWQLLVGLAQRAALIFHGGGLAPRLYRPQRQACDVGLAGVPCRTCTLGW
jgi:hypothetical protein